MKVKWNYPEDRRLSEAQELSLRRKIATLEEELTVARYELHLSAKLKEDTHHDCKYSLCPEGDNLRGI